MNRVLLVDDEIQAVRGLKEGVDWSQFSVDHIYTANNIRQAKEIFAQHEIHLMICDIEMPQGDGLQLQEWVQERYATTVSIFLTCHADFKYAKQAIRLGSMDYLLKPIRFAELEAVIRKAFRKIHSNREQVHMIQTYKRYYELRTLHQPLVVDRFWSNMLNRLIAPEAESITSIIQKLSLPYRWDMPVALILIGIVRWLVKTSESEQQAWEQSILNGAKSQLLKESDHGAVLPFTKSGLLVVLPIQDQTGWGPSQAKRKCRTFIDTHTRNLCDVSCVIGVSSGLPGVASLFEEVTRFEQDHVTVMNEPFLIGELAGGQTSLAPVDMNHWHELLAEGDTSKLVGEIERAFGNASRSRWDVKALHTAKRDFLQMIYYFLKQRGLLANQVLSHEAFHEGEAFAGRSVDGMREWLLSTVREVDRTLQTAKQAESVVDRVKQYIIERIDQDLTREDIAQLFFLHPDYLARIFKKETGLTLSDFIIQQRVRNAKELLIRTDMPIGSIAGAVGYANFSHFSKVFRKVAAMNPADFRKKHRVI